MIFSECGKILISYVFNNEDMTVDCQSSKRSKLVIDKIYVSDDKNTV